MLQWLLLLERPIFLRAFTFRIKLVEFFVYLFGSCIVRKTAGASINFNWWINHKMTVGLLFFYYFCKCFENTQKIKILQPGCAFYKDSPAWCCKMWFTELVFFRNRHSLGLHFSLGLSEKLGNSRKKSVSERKYVTSLHVVRRHQSMLCLHLQNVFNIVDKDGKYFSFG